MVSRLSLGCALVTPMLAAVAFAAACDGASGAPDGGPVTVRIGGLTVRAELALTPQERALGLGGRASLAEGEGMLFVFRQERQHTFCMCEMQFPLDFVWIDGDQRVVDLTQDVPPPAAGEPPQQIRPAAPVQYVLEVNAGAVAQEGVAVGDSVSFEPEVSPESAS